MHAARYRFEIIEHRRPGSAGHDNRHLPCSGHQPMTTREPTPRPAKILLVDDDSENRDLVRFALERDGHTVVTAEAGIEGLEVAREFHPDVAFVDIMMPGLDGYAVASALRRDLGPAAWIVALSGLPEHRSRN